MNYYLSMQGRAIGPMTASQLMAYNVNPNTQVSAEGGSWQPLYTFPELMEAYTRKQNETTDSKRILCGLMAIFFGAFGVQYFILGKVGGGFITILLSLITCGAWEIVTLIQGILMLCMNDSEFRRKYVDNPATFPLF